MFFGQNSNFGPIISLKPALCVRAGTNFSEIWNERCHAKFLEGHLNFEWTRPPDWPKHIRQLSWRNCLMRLGQSGGLIYSNVPPEILHDISLLIIWYNSIMVVVHILSIRFTFSAQSLGDFFFLFLVFSLRIFAVNSYIFHRKYLQNNPE